MLKSFPLAGGKEVMFYYSLFNFQHCYKEHTLLYKSQIINRHKMEKKYSVVLWNYSVEECSKEEF